MSSRKKILLGAAGASAAAALIGVKTLIPDIGADIKTVRPMKKFMKRIMISFQSGLFVVDFFEAQAAKNPNKTFVIFEDRHYSYGFMNDMANKVANIAKTWNLKPGDIVASIIHNEPAFLWTFLGLLKVGLPNALINYHLTSKPLIHSLKVSEAKVIIVGAGEGLLESILSCHKELPNVPFYVMGKTQSDLPTGFLSFEDEMQKSLPVQFSKVVRSHVDVESPMCFIYTSGTTGLPKPVIFKHSKGIALSHAYIVHNFTSRDVAYAVTPMYHIAALVVVFCCIYEGATMVLRGKFSARHYWEDVRKHNVTVLSYIGELLRYLLQNPKSPLDGVHKVRVAMGNGLRPDIWKEFQRRFKIPHIIEFFGATEGTSSLMNLTNKIGAVGRWSPFMAWLSVGGLTGGRFIRYDPIADVPCRDKSGKCIEIKPGEEGMFIAPLPPTYDGLYKGSPELSEKKILRDVFVKGDAYFCYGDMMYMDKSYWIYFRDRVGDTFRWKGENVSTREVCDVISTLDFIDDVNVYGVKVPGTEGRAGMAALTLKENVVVNPDLLQTLYQKCERDLPSYARPLFIRVQKEFIVTQTMKHKKVELVADGFDPEKIIDPLYFMNREQKTYVPLIKTDQIVSAKL